MDNCPEYPTSNCVTLVPLPFVAVLLVGMVFSGLSAGVIYLVVYRTLRVRHVPLMNIVIATIGMSILLQNVSMLVWGSEPMTYPKLFAIETYRLGPVRFSPQLVWIIALGFALMLLLQAFLAFTRT